MKLFNKRGYIPLGVFSILEEKIKQEKEKSDNYLSLIADLIRINTLISVARSGTGHLGASLSIIELLTEIYFRSFIFSSKNLHALNRDMLILSKGHGVPSLYAVLAAKGYFLTNKLDRLRRLKGLEGHCDFKTPGIDANTGSLGMGLSKAVGYAIAKKRFGYKGNLIVIVGNGELQEGQCWEAFLSATNYKCDNLYVIIDDNKIQTDQFTQNIVNYGNLKDAVRNIGFAVEEAKGREIGSIYQVLNKLKKIRNKPKLFWCHTAKGQGISFMEHTATLKSREDRYLWHNKAPNLEQLNTALNEILASNKKILKDLNFVVDIKKSLVEIPREFVQTDIKGDSLITGFSRGLVECASKFKNFIVFDADLEEDCGFREFHRQYPARFFEMGIMEQHLVSAASSFARLGYIPVISTYAAFLSSRANEQLYNFVSEEGRALIVGNMSGVIPATPGKSHQGFRDIACLKNIPSITLYQPISADDVKNILERYFKSELGKVLYLRLSMAQSAVELATPIKDLKKGSPQILCKGQDVIIIGIGPVLLGECVKASENLTRKGIEAEIWNYPWIVDFDLKTLLDASKRNIPLIIIEDHYIKGGLGESLLSYLAQNRISFKKIKHLALFGFPRTGFRQEALQYFGLDRDSIASAVFNLLR